MRALIFISALLSLQAFSQTVKFVSDIDTKLTIKSVNIIPLADNMSGIYSKPLTDTLQNELQSNHQWEAKIVDLKSNFSPEELETKPDLVKQTLKKTVSASGHAADSLMTGRISKGPAGITIKLSLYSGTDGLPIGIESLTDVPNFEIAELKNKLPSLVRTLVAKLPYHATVLSRRNQSVTLNMGTASGISAGDELTAIQIIKVNRHPKFNFVVSTENLTLGTIKIEKADEFISFGNITTEREAGIIESGVKLSAAKFVAYQNKAQDAIAFGDKPHAWMPSTPPSFGKVGVLFGFAQYTASNNITGTGGVTGNSSLTPNLHMNGEIWFDPNWYMNLTLRSYVLSFTNPLAGSTPGTLNVSTTQSNLSIGHNFLIDEDFFGPKIQTSLGYATTSAFIDDSTPTALESMTFSGMTLGLAGSFPIASPTRNYPFVLGVRLNYYLSATAKESPTSSGASVSPHISSFAGFIETRINERMNIRSELMFDMFSADFSGAASRSNPASSASHKISTLAAGIEYMF